MKFKITVPSALFFLLTNLTLVATTNFTAVQDDTVMAREAETPPIIDGKADDACWAQATWQTIDQVWIPWGGSMDPADFTGRFKVTWSSETDRIYFLVEIIDDVLVDGYKYPQDGYYNWDVVEIFFDEDASGGDHTLNQNAFAYHITAGNDEVEFQAMDLAANWAAMNYSDHLDCKIEQLNGAYIWEISMIVYNEDYKPGQSNNPTEQLEVGKVSGLSIAYCDNDNPNENPKTRDNFIGSVEVTQARHNHHWQDASDFGTLKLVATNPTRVDHNTAPGNFSLNQNYPNPFNPVTTISFHLPTSAQVELSIYNTLGQMVRTLADASFPEGTHAVPWNALDEAGSPVNSGVYFYQLTAHTTNGVFQQKQKMVLAR